MQTSGTGAAFSLSTLDFESEIILRKLHVHPLIYLSPTLYNFSKLFNDMSQRTAVRIADFTTGRISRTELHWLSYTLIEHGIAHI